MKKYSLLLISILAVSSAFTSCAKGPQSPSEDPIDRHDYTKLVWSDEFNGDSLNDDNWSYQLGTGDQYGLTDWGNQEAQYYQEDNVEVKDGNLVITARKEKVRNKEYTSGRIRTSGKVTTTYGRIEARMSLPEVTGMWPAFWMLPERSPYGNWPYSGEIDIMEARGRVTNMTSSAIHYGGPSDIYKSASHVIRDEEDSISQYHVYAVEWSENEMVCYVDDDVSLKLRRGDWFSMSVDAENKDAPFDVDFYIIFNLAVGGHFDGFKLPGDDFESAEMKVDYVRIYDKEVSN